MSASGGNGGKQIAERSSSVTRAHSGVLPRAADSFGNRLRPLLGHLRSVAKEGNVRDASYGDLVRSTTLESVRPTREAADFCTVLGIGAAHVIGGLEIQPELAAGAEPVP